MGQKVSKNTNYAIDGHTFLAITQPFLANRAEFFIVTQETIIYRLVMKNPGFGPYFRFFGLAWA